MTPVGGLASGIKSDPIVCAYSENVSPNAMCSSVSLVGKNVLDKTAFDLHIDGPRSVATTSVVVAAVCCGNGVVESDEECDDGNTDDQDGCTAACEADSDNDGVSDVSDLDRDNDGVPDAVECPIPVGQPDVSSHQSIPLAFDAMGGLDLGQLMTVEGQDFDLSGLDSALTGCGMNVSVVKTVGLGSMEDGWPQLGLSLIHI